MAEYIVFFVYVFTLSGVTDLIDQLGSLYITAIFVDRFLLLKIFKFLIEKLLQ